MKNIKILGSGCANCKRLEATTRKVVDALGIEAEIEKVRQEKASVVKRQDYEEAARLRDKERNLQSDLEIAKREWEARTKDIVHDVSEEDIATVVAMMTGIPVNRVAQTESEKLLKMEESLKSFIVGQDEAVTKLTKAIRRTRAGLKNPNRPIGSFIFLGPTGVGKTELCKVLAKYLFDSDNALIRIDMSEYMEKFSLSRLVGAPPGYVGYEEGGQLTEAVRRRPYSVVLLDEIEKAHPDVFNVLLQVLDDGRLTDNQGRTVNFKNTIIIMTSNLGSHLIQEKLEQVDEENIEDVLGELRYQLTDLLRKTIRPEFLNRIDEIVLFKPLTRSEIRKIVDLQIENVQKMLAQKEIVIEVDDEAKDWLAKLGYDVTFGARPLKRTIQRHLVNPLSQELLAGKFSDGDNIKVSLGMKGQLEFKKVEAKGISESN